MSPPSSGRTVGDHQEEEKLSESLSESDLKHNLSTMFSSMVVMDHQGGRRHSRAAVHPIDDQYYQKQEQPSHTRRIESLPPPLHHEVIQQEKHRGEKKKQAAVTER